MSPLQLLATLGRPSPPARTLEFPRPVVLTRAETAECTCPEHCERDHDAE